MYVGGREHGALEAVTQFADLIDALAGRSRAAGDGTLRGPGVWSTGAPLAQGQAESGRRVPRLRKAKLKRVRPVGRRWLRDAKRRLEAKRAAEARPIPRSRSERVRESKRRLEEEHRVKCRANEAYDAYRVRGVMRDGRRFGAPPKPYQPPADTQPEWR
jgi:hypothetical protein